MSYLIQNNVIVGFTTKDLKSGQEVQFSNVAVGDQLVNAEYAKVSNAQKWAKKLIDFNGNEPFAELIDDTRLYHCYLIR